MKSPNSEIFFDNLQESMTDFDQTKLIQLEIDGPNVN